MLATHRTIALAALIWIGLAPAARAAVLPTPPHAGAVLHFEVIPPAAEDTVAVPPLAVDGPFGFADAVAQPPQPWHWESELAAPVGGPIPPFVAAFIGPGGAAVVVFPGGLPGGAVTPVIELIFAEAPEVFGGHMFRFINGLPANTIEYDTSIVEFDPPPAPPGEPPGEVIEFPTIAALLSAFPQFGGLGLTAGTGEYTIAVAEGTFVPALPPLGLGLLASGLVVAAGWGMHASRKSRAV